MEDLINLSGIEIGRNIRVGRLVADEVFAAFKERINKYNPALNSFVEVYDSAVRGEGDSALRGTPVAIKDNICISGKVITCASKILSSHRAVYDATVIKKLKQAGLQIIGTGNMDEFAFGSSTENSCYGVAKNPWDQTRVSGGSSGGCAAAVAARLSPLALGSDTGGSIRQPAAFCGVVGFKPTYGRVSRLGLVAFGSSLDQIGPITTNFSDCAQLLNIICGWDDFDSTSSPVEVPDFTQELKENIGNMRIGIPEQYFGKGLSMEVKEAIEKAVDIFKKKKARIVNISLPHTDYAVATYYIIASCEASSNLQRFDGIKYGVRQEADSLINVYAQTRQKGFGEEVKRRIFLGTHSLSSGYYDAYYMRALRLRRLIKQDFDKAFEQADVILTPTTPTPAFKIGDRTKDPLSMYLSDIYTISVNLAGLPAVSFPCGFTKDNLPIGMQLISREFDEASLIRLGFSYQSVTDFHKRIPEMSG